MVQRLKNREVQKSLFPTKPTKADNPNPTKSEREVHVYTSFGLHHFLDENDDPCLLDFQDLEAEDHPNAMAKIVELIDQTPKYYVLADSSGMLFNPHGDESEGKITSRATHKGERNWNFVEVKKSTFQLYIKFLKTKNRSYLYNAEREYLYG